jgi:hypothetical protein
MTRLLYGNTSPRVLKSKVPRYIRRIIHDTTRCHYQREEYATAGERNARYTLLRGIPGLVRYSDSNQVGIMVWVVAWPRVIRGEGMTPATEEGRGGPPYNALRGNLKKSPVETVSMETGL